MIKQILISIAILIIAMNTFTNQDKLKTYSAFQNSIYAPLEMEETINIEPSQSKPLEFKLFSDHKDFFFPLSEQEKTKGVLSAVPIIEKDKKTNNTLEDMYKAKTLSDLLYAKTTTATTPLLANNVKSKSAIKEVNLDAIDTKGLRSLTVEKDPKKLFQYYKKGLGLQESNNDYKTVNTKTSSGTWGKYQLMGKYVEKDIKRVTSATSMKDFLNKPKEQEKFFEWYYKNNLEPNLKRMKKEGYGKKFSDIELLGMIHFRGPSGARTAIAEGLNKKKESYNPTVNSYLQSLLNYANT